MYRSRSKVLPSGRDPRFVAADVKLLEPLSRYAYLPTNHLIEFDDRAVTRRKQRLTDFRHDLTNYIIRERAKMHEQSFYKLGPLGVQALKDYQFLDDEQAENLHRTRAGGGVLNEHNAFAAMAVAQIELSAKKFGVRFIPHTEILKKAGQLTFAVPLGDTHLKPDAVFGLQYENEFKFFALEYDRGSEDIKTTWQRKLDCYKKAKAIIPKRLGIPKWNVLCMIPKTHKRKDRPKNIKALITQPTPDIWFFELHGNAHFENVPPPSDDLFTLPWTRVGHSNITLKG